MLQVVAPINLLLDTVPFTKCYYSLDWHPADHVSFIDNVQMRPLVPGTAQPALYATPAFCAATLVMGPMHAHRGGGGESVGIASRVVKERERWGQGGWWTDATDASACRRLTKWLIVPRTASGLARPPGTSPPAPHFRGCSRWR